MNKITRSEFIQKSGAGFMGLALSGLPDNTKHSQRLSLSSIAFPDWEFTKFVNFTASAGYQAIEMRGIKRELDLTKCPEFSKKNINATKQYVKNKGLLFLSLGSSAQMHHSDPVKRKENIDEAKRYIDLAEELHCPYIRVFPNLIPKDIPKEKTFYLIADGLHTLASHAKGSNVSILMETHGELLLADDLKTVMDLVIDKPVGLIWDICNMYSITKEPVSKVYNTIRSYIRHVHIKDAKLTNNKVNYVLTGEGEIPIHQALRLLYQSGYKGYYSFEWEKLWAPEIEDSEVAALHFKNNFKKFIK